MKQLVELVREGEIIQVKTSEHAFTLEPIPISDEYISGFSPNRIAIRPDLAVEAIRTRTGNIIVGFGDPTLCKNRTIPFPYDGLRKVEV